MARRAADGGWQSTGMFKHASGCWRAIALRSAQRRGWGDLFTGAAHVDPAARGRSMMGMNSRLLAAGTENSKTLIAQVPAC